MSTTNLVGLVKLSQRRVQLSPENPIHWGEIVLHGYDRDEFMERQAGKVAVLLSGVSEANAGDIFQVGDHVALIDCMIFAPEFISVLKAVEAMKLSTVPFQNGSLLNLSRRKVC